MGAGVVLEAPHGEVIERSIALSGRGCNNEAEALALLAGLELATAHGARVIIIRTDSTVLVEQLARPPARPLVRLKGLLDQVGMALQAFDHVSWQWIPGHRNTQADALARQALGMPERPPAQHPGLKRRPRQKP
jgi:ribonuclease HI